MKNHFIQARNHAAKFVVFALLFALVFSSCTRKVYIVKKVPPGHAKKMTGAKSAKAYAPGQVKKHKHH